MFQRVSWPVFYVHPSSDRDCGLSCSVGELAWFSMCIALVTVTVASLVLESKLAWFSMCTLLVTESVACLISVGKLASF